MSRSFDVVIFGASGFTGQFVVQEFAKHNSQNLRWAVAGRNKEKLQNVLQQASEQSGWLILDATVVACNQST
jgi:short subunit dehydrogenase-like uncharacterized protein